MDTKTRSAQITRTAHINHATSRVYVFLRALYTFYFLSVFAEMGVVRPVADSRSDSSGEKGEKKTAEKKDVRAYHVCACVCVCL